MVCWGLAPVFGKWGLYQTNPVSVLCLRTLIAASVVLAWTIGSGGFAHIRAIAPRNWVFITIEALLATLIGDLAYFAALKYGRINEVTLVTSASPLITIFTAFLLMGERLTYSQLAGAFLIVAGLLLVGMQPRL